MSATQLAVLFFVVLMLNLTDFFPSLPTLIVSCIIFAALDKILEKMEEKITLYEHKDNPVLGLHLVTRLKKNRRTDHYLKTLPRCCERCNNFYFYANETTDPEGNLAYVDVPKCRNHNNGISERLCCDSFIDRVILL